MNYSTNLNNNSLLKGISVRNALNAYWNNALSAHTHIHIQHTYDTANLQRLSKQRDIVVSFFSETPK